MNHTGKTAKTSIRLRDFVSRNVNVNDRRTSIRLEKVFWDALEDIARSENTSIRELCSRIDTRRGRAISLTAAMRTFMITFYRIKQTLAPGLAEAGQSPLVGQPRFSKPVETALTELED